MTKILVGIPTHKRPELLEKTLDSISHQENVYDFDIRVFVVDNDFVSREGAMLVERISSTYRFPISARLVEEPGISAVRNEIMKEAKNGADFVAMIDDDETATLFWLDCLIEVARSTKADIIGGPVEYDFEMPPSPSLQRSKAFWQPHRPKGFIDFISGTGNVMISCRALERLKWPAFDLAFGLTGGGDEEWFTRLKKSGANFAWAPYAITVETVPAERATARWALRRNFRVGIGDIRIALRHHGPFVIARKFAEAVAILMTVPFTLPILAFPGVRLRTMRRWTRALGRLNAIFGRHYREYAVRHE